MLSADEIEVLGEKAQRIISPVVNFLIQEIARRVSEAGQLTSTAAYQVWRAQQLGVSQQELKKELAKRLRVSLEELEQLLTQSAEVGYNFDLKNLPHTAAVAFSENRVVQQIVSTAVQMAQEDLSNMVQTIGFVGPDKKPRPLTQAYQQACDFAFQKVATGAQDYNSAVLEATRELADKGIVVINYESGVHTSLEAVVRRNVMGGLGLMQERISQQNHDDFCCNGWEISAHAASAPDHEPIQGKQYSDAEYESLNNSLVRRIGTLNCGHTAFPIILGVSRPQYTAAELEKMRLDNQRGVEYEGRHYTAYEATQRQRKLERAIRKQRKRILVSEATGDEKQLSIDRTNLVRLEDEYIRFSKAAGLRLERERMNVVKFGPKQATAAEKSYADIANQANSMYDIGSTDANVTAFLRDQPIRRKIGGEEYPLTLHQGRQNKHIPGTHEFTQYAKTLSVKGQFGPSCVTVGEETVRALVKQYHGTGILLRSKDGAWRGVERITNHPDRIGVAVNNLSGAEADTTTFTIHYSKDGFHIVPDYPSRKGEKAKK